MEKDEISSCVIQLINTHIPHPPTNTNNTFDTFVRIKQNLILTTTTQNKTTYNFRIINIIRQSNTNTKKCFVVINNDLKNNGIFVRSMIIIILENKFNRFKNYDVDAINCFVHVRQPTPLLEVFHHIICLCSHWPCNKFLEDKVHNCHEFMEHLGMINLPIAKKSLHIRKLLTWANL